MAQHTPERTPHAARQWAGWHAWTLPTWGWVAVVVAAALEAATLAGTADDAFRVGGIPLPWSAVAAAAVAVALGRDQLGVSRRQLTAWAPLLIPATVVAVAAATAAPTQLAAGVGVASAAEELVFRVAVPLATVAVAVAATRRRRAAASPLLLVPAGAWFALAPGHLAQAGTLVEWLPFVAFAALTLIVVHRTGVVLPAVAVHVAVNLTTEAAAAGAVGPAAHHVVVVALLAGLYAGALRAAPRLGRTTAETAAESGRVAADTTRTITQTEMSAATLPTAPGEPERVGAAAPATLGGPHESVRA